MTASDFQVRQTSSDEQRQIDTINEADEENPSQLVVNILSDSFEFAKIYETLFLSAYIEFKHGHLNRNKYDSK